MYPVYGHLWWLSFTANKELSLSYGRKSMSNWNPLSDRISHRLLTVIRADSLSASFLFSQWTFLSSLKGKLYVPSPAAEGCAPPHWHDAVYHALPADVWYGHAEHETAPPSQPGVHEELVHGPKRRDTILSRQAANQCSFLFSILFFSYLL